MNIGHVLDGKAEAFATKAALFIAAVRHVVDTKRGHVVDDNTAEVEFSDGVKGAVDVAGKDGGLQAVTGGVGLAEGFVEVAEGEDAGDGAEDFVAHDAHVGLRVGEESGVNERALTISASEDTGTGGPGFTDPGFDTVGFLLGDHRADVSLFG